jgi:hypothetical protein
MLEENPPIGVVVLLDDQEMQEALMEVLAMQEFSVRDLKNCQFPNELTKLGSRQLLGLQV